MALGAAQVVIGATVGCRFINTSPRMILRVIGLSIGSTLLLLCTSLTFAFLISMWTGDRFIGLVLAYSPGGFAEMSLIALSSASRCRSSSFITLFAFFLWSQVPRRYFDLRRHAEGERDKTLSNEIAKDSTTGTGGLYSSLRTVSFVAKIC